jgi:hypothetical protein
MAFSEGKRHLTMVTPVYIESVNATARIFHRRDERYDLLRIFALLAVRLHGRTNTQPYFKWGHWCP